MSQALKQYRCYFLNRHGGIVDMASFGCADDAAAVAEARLRFARQSDYPSFELWERARRVHRETTTMSQAAEDEQAASSTTPAAPRPGRNDIPKGAGLD